MENIEAPVVEVRTLIEKGEVEFVRIEVADLNGCSIGFLLEASFFIDNCQLGFSMSQAIFSLTVQCEYFGGQGLMTDDLIYRNIALYPDMETFCLIPWRPRTASVIANAQEDLRNEASPLYRFSPRNLCLKEVGRLRENHNLRLYSTFEYEFHLLDPVTDMPVFNNAVPFSTQLLSKHESLATDVMRNMKMMGISPQRFHTEHGQGQFEVTSRPVFGLQCSDNAFRLKQLVKEVGCIHGYKSVWMSKPFADGSGSSGHFNHSLWNEDGVNVLYDLQMEYGLSKIGRSWLAGLVHHSDALLALACNTPNCMERNNAGGHAPDNNAWGLDNRCVAYRINDHDTKNTYIEVRLAGAATNPYLLQAGCIVAGMDGIRQDMVLKGEPYDKEIFLAASIPEHVTKLPKSLSIAMDCLLKNEVFVEAFGEDFLQMYTSLKKYEDSLADKHRAEGDLFHWYRDYYGEFI